MNTKPLTVRFARDGKWIQAYCLEVDLTSIMRYCALRDHYNRNWCYSKRAKSMTGEPECELSTPTMPNSAWHSEKSPMQISYDPQADAIYIQLIKGEVDDTLQAGKYIHVDVDREGVPLGIEILFAGRALAREDMTSITVNISQPIPAQR